MIGDSEVASRLRTLWLSEELLSWPQNYRNALAACLSHHKPFDRDAIRESAKPELSWLHRAVYLEKMPSLAEGYTCTNRVTPAEALTDDVCARCHGRGFVSHLPVNENDDSKGTFYVEGTWDCPECTRGVTTGDRTT